MRTGCRSAGTDAGLRLVRRAHRDAASPTRTQRSRVLKALRPASRPRDATPRRCARAPRTARTRYRATDGRRTQTATAVTGFPHDRYDRAMIVVPPRAWCARERSVAGDEGGSERLEHARPRPSCKRRGVPMPRGERSGDPPSSPAPRPLNNDGAKRTTDRTSNICPGLISAARIPFATRSDGMRNSVPLRDALERVAALHLVGDDAAGLDVREVVAACRSTCRAARNDA